MKILLAAGLVFGAAGLTAFPPTHTVGAGLQQSSASATPVSDIIKRAYHAAYNLDYAEATTLAKRAVEMAPDESATHRALASIIWLDILFKRGVCTVDHFIGGMTKAVRGEPSPVVDLEAEFKQEMTRSIELAEARLKSRPADIEARHDVGAAYAIQASYAASIEGSLIAAFRSAKRAYDAHEEVLAKSPNRADANFTVGIYRYAISTLSMPTRWLAYAVGFGGGKERGISQLESTIFDADVHVDAKAALLLIYTREGRHEDALHIVRDLEAEFPRNRLFTFEHGASAIRADHADEADATLTRGLTALAKDDRPKFPGELALWLYKRAVARRMLNHLPDAKADLSAAAASQPAGWVRGRIRLEFGRQADLGGRRQEAVGAYQEAKTICEQYADLGCARTAAEYLKKPFVR